MLGIIMPMGRTMMYLPDSNENSGPWTELDTKVCIALTLVILIITLVSTLIEATVESRGSSFKKSIIDIFRYPFDASMFTCMFVLTSLSVLTTWVLVGLVVGVLNFM